MKRRHLLAAGAATALLATRLPSGASASPRKASPLDSLVLGPEVDLGVQQTTVAINDGVVGTEDGTRVYYVTVSGQTAVFNVVDIAGNELLRSFDLPGVTQVWRHAIAPDGSVYIAGIANGAQSAVLWRYSPATKQVEELGAIPGEKSPWSMVVADDGMVYIGTFQRGRVISYDPGTGTFRDYGSMVEGQQYVRSMAHRDGFVYAGIGSVGSVVKLDVASGDRTVISDAVPGLLGVAAADVPFAYDMAIAGDWLFVKFGGSLNTLLFYNLVTGTWSDVSVGKELPGNTGIQTFNQVPVRDGKAHVAGNGTIYQIDLATLEATRTPVSWGTSLRGAGWVPDGSSWLASITYSGQIVRVDVTSTGKQAGPVVLRGAANPLHQLETAPDGTLFMAGYPGGSGARFNPRTRSTEQFPMAQAEGMVGVGDRMYFGMYPGGTIQHADLAASPTKVVSDFTIGEEQDRPYAMRESDGLLLIGTIPAYGQYGGALTIHDLAAGTTRVHRNLVADQSIIGVARRGRRIYGSTTIFPGLGVDPIATGAKVFVFDMDSETVLQESGVDLPGVDSPRMISGLSFGPDDLLWGSVDGWIFALDPDDLSVVKSKQIFPDVDDYGFWRPVYLRWGADGLLFANVASRITVIDPASLDHVVVTDPTEEVGFFTLGADGDGRQNIYLIGAKDTSRLRMIPTGRGAARALDLANNGFEAATRDGIRNWTIEGAGAARSLEVHHTGRASLGLDTEAGAELSVRSQAVAVPKGGYVRATAEARVSGGGSSGRLFCLEFLDAAGTVVGRGVDHLAGGLRGQGWTEVQASGPVPAGAGAVRVVIVAEDAISAHLDTVRLQVTV